MKKIVSWVSIALAIQILGAQQIQIQALKPNPYFIKSEDIFNLQITNPSSISIQTKLKGVWFYEGNKAVELAAENFTINPGINNVSSNSINVLSKTYFIKAVEDVESATGIFPAGKFRACIYLECVDPNCNGAGASIISRETDPCYEFSVEQPTPLLLSTPFNGNVSNNHRPNFSWIPPMPIANNLELNYTFTLVQKTTAKQSCTEAIIRNRPIYKADDITGIFLNYPADLDQLDTGNYAWQVSANYEGIVVATSEAWCFEVKEEKEKIDSNVYVKFKTTDNDIHHCKKKLYLSYEELYNGEELKFKLYNQKGDEILIKQKYKSAYGECKFVFDLDELKLRPNQVYTLTLKNQIGKNYKVKFKVIN